MIDLYRFYVNPFDDEDISVDELTAYGDAHLARMTGQNPGNVLDASIAATGNLLTALDASISNETVRSGVQAATVRAKNDFRAALPNELSKPYGTTLSKYGKKGAKMLEIWPGGLSAYGDSSDGGLDGLLTALQAALFNNKTDLGPDPATQVQALAAQWEAVYGTANTNKGQNLSAADTRRLAVKTLRLQLFKNLLQLAALFPNQRDKADYYHPQHLLENAAPAPAATPAATTATTGGQAANDGKA